MSRKITFSLGENYHIYNRGNDKRIIFQNKTDYDRFIALLYLCNSVKNIKLSDYPNTKLEKLLDIKRGETMRIKDIMAFPDIGDNKKYDKKDKILFIYDYINYFNKRDYYTKDELGKVIEYL